MRRVALVGGALLVASVAWGVDTPTPLPTPSPVCTDVSTPTPANTATFTVTITCPPFFTPPAGTPTPTPTLAGTCGPTIAEVNTLDEHDDGCCDAADCTFVEAVHANDTDGAIVGFKVGLAGTLLQKLSVAITHAISVIGNDTVIVQSGNWRFIAPVSTPTPGWTPVPVTVSHLTFACGGYSPGGGGGGVLDFANGYTCLTIENDTFLNNTAGGVGGAIRFDGVAGSCVAISASTFEGNTAGAEGGAIKLLNSTWSISSSIFSNNHVTTDGGPGGGAVSIGGSGAGTITNSQFRANTALHIGDGGGAIRSADGATSISITTSTFDDNKAFIDGGALETNLVANGSLTRSTFARNTIAAAGDLKGSAWLDTSGNGSGTWTITNNTFEANVCDGCVGAFFAGAAELENPASTYTLLYNTFANNNGGSGADGGALTFPNPNVTINSNIFFNNTPYACTNNEFVAATSTGHNISSDNTCSLFSTDDWPNTSAMLFPLLDNSGSPQTMAITVCSPAWNTGDVGTEPGTDERGVSRPQSVGPDRGAFELVAEVDTPTPTVTPSPTPTPFGCWHCPNGVDSESCPMFSETPPTPGCTPIVGGHCEVVN